MANATETLPNGVTVRRDLTILRIMPENVFLLWAEATGARRFRLTEQLAPLAVWTDGQMFLVRDTEATRKGLNVMIHKHRFVLIDHDTKNIIWHFCKPDSD